MTRPLNQEELERLLYFLKGDKEALLLCLDLVYCGHLWDDLIDQDNPRSEYDIHQAFIKAFRDIPMNPFFQRWQPYLQPFLISAAQQYIDSTKLEFSSDRDDRLMAFIIRNATLSFIHHCIYITGLAAGELDWINQVAEEFWKLFKLRDRLEYFILDEAPVPLSVVGEGV
jgi:hypothetical protein